MDGSTFAIMAVSILGFLAVRGYIGCVIRVSLSKKERKQYLASTSLLSRWFVWSTHKWCNDKVNGREKRKIRYATVFKMYRVVFVILHIELALVFISELLGIIEETLTSLSDYCCGLYLISLLASFFFFAIIEYMLNARIHRRRYRWLK